MRQFNFARAPGFDILASSADGTVGAALILEDSYLVVDTCPNAAFSIADLKAQTRPPPGTEQFLQQVEVPANCTADPQGSTILDPLPIYLASLVRTSVWNRCWDSRINVSDMELYGANVRLTDGAALPANYRVKVLNTLSVCRWVVPMACVNELQLLGCSTFVTRNLTAAWLRYGSAPPPPANVSASPAAPAGSPEPCVSLREDGRQSKSSSDGDDDDDDSTNVTAILVGSIVGGVAALLIVALVVAAFVWRRRRVQAYTAPAGGPGPETGVALDHDRSLEAAEEGALVSKEGGDFTSLGGAGKSPAKPAASSAGPSTEDSGQTPVKFGVLGPVRLVGPDDDADSVRPSTATAATTITGGGTTNTFRTTNSSIIANRPRGSDSLAIRSSIPEENSQQSSLLGVGDLTKGSLAPLPTPPHPGTPPQGSAPVVPVSDPSGAANAPIPVVQLLPKVLGKGGFGRVVEGVYRGQPCAVKIIVGPGLAQAAAQASGSGAGASSALCDPKVTHALHKELEMLACCDHPNIVKLLAASLEPPRPFLVMEKMEMSLNHLLYGRRRASRGEDGEAVGVKEDAPGSTVLPLFLVLHIATEVAQGLSYLHPQIIHRDLKPGNVLITGPWDDSPVVKLSDFGLSRIQESVCFTLHPEAGTPAYVAPECYNVENSIITHDADMYSFGVLLWEMLAGTPPWAGLGTVPIATQVTLLNNRLPLPPPPDAPGGCRSRWPPRLIRLIASCWDPVPARRPAAAEVVKLLLLAKQGLQMEGALPADPVESEPATPVAAR
ncbi:hypothetical protein HYH03_012609 [Edaphochlamys debaryana]|uniref:Protein kinase domain-containing protein n=1 Tax=Edaphochlamys debaryana TaxID=47281 RepID=A0A835XXR8_9CHLO|nr:hypothetical protein HYH03_012609 [Edaphochlamys debaryana]|eukprot:KAG2488810.1 hypothetical protein HYH03_012609 [Edaphochlamys debaryana]